MDCTSSALRIVVTGGSRGIGASIVDAFAGAGHDVFFTFNKSNVEASAVVERHAAGGSRVHAEKLDQGVFSQVRQVARSIERWLGGQRLDVLVNCAALGSKTVEAYCLHEPDGNDDETEAASARSAQEDEALMRVNALGPVWLTEALMPLMERAHSPATADGKPQLRPTVLFIGSVGGCSQSVFPGFKLADAMSKAALAYAVKCLAARHAQGAVNILCLSPGATLTPMFKASTLDAMQEPQEFVEKALPQRRLIDPCEVAAACYWLCTNPAARIFHGAVLDASQGLAVRPGLITEFQEKDSSMDTSKEDGHI